MTDATFHRRLTLIPDAPLGGTGPLTMLCSMAAIYTLRAAAGWVWGLPYGRNARRDDPALVLVEGRGTCSSKHAFLAELAAEAGVEAELRLCIYALSAETDPKLAGLLQTHGVPWLPEAHCCLAVDGQRVDLTAAGPSKVLPLLHEEVITPAQVADHKPRVHRAWIERRAQELGMSGEALWALREACIEALSD